MKQPLIVEMDDGTSYDIDADARDIRAWEAQHDASWFATTTSFTNLAQVAYIAGRRTGVLNGTYPTYEAFDAHCVDARGRPARVVGRPTRAGRTATSSVASPADSASSPRHSNKRARM